MLLVSSNFEFLKAIAVFLSKQAMVIGPTPPGTGVIADAFFSAYS